MEKISEKNFAGFTMLELVVVIIIISIIASIAIPRSPGTNINLNAQANQLAGDIRYTQTLAMSRGSRYRINFLSSTSYSFSDTNGNVVNNSITGQPTTTLQPGIIMTLPPTNLPNNVLTFDPQGIPYTDSTGTVALSATASIKLTAGSNTLTVSLTPQTGRVTVP